MAAVAYIVELVAAVASALVVGAVVALTADRDFVADRWRIIVDASRKGLADALRVCESTIDHLVLAPAGQPVALDPSTRATFFRWKKVTRNRECDMGTSQIENREIAVQVRLKGPLLVALEDWRRAQPIIPVHPKAIRELLERALAERLRA